MQSFFIITSIEEDNYPVPDHLLKILMGAFNNAYSKT